MNDLFTVIQSIFEEMKIIKKEIQQQKKTRIDEFNETWVDGQDVIQTLHISKRTLQTLRTSGVLPFSRLNGKFYYKLADIERLLESNYSSQKSQSYDK